MIERRKVVSGGAALGLAALIDSAAQSRVTAGQTPRRKAFRPGEPWLDTKNEPIQVRGGSIIQVGDTFYWYGENKERTTGKDRIWHWGMRMYASRDLYNWDDLGTFIPPVPDDPKSPLHPFQFADRPHILFNKRTGKYVCWIKFLADQDQTRTVLVADKVTGPYRIVSSGVLPLGMGAGDFDMFASPDDGKAYMAFERVHTEMIIADLNDDYTGLSGYYSTHWPEIGPPDTREGLAYFRRGGLHYMASSGTTGYFPNPSKVGVSKSFHGPWQDLGSLDRGDPSVTSFNSQISSVFKVPFKKDLYIALADRWNGPIDDPEFADGTLSRKVRKAFHDRFVEGETTPEDERVFKRWGGLDINTSLGRHVWLPIKWEGDRPWIEWRDTWSLDEFEDI